MSLRRLTLFLAHIIGTNHQGVAGRGGLWTGIMPVKGWAEASEKICGIPRRKQTMGQSNKHEVEKRPARFSDTSSSFTLRLNDKAGRRLWRRILHAFSLRLPPTRYPAFVHVFLDGLPPPYRVVTNICGASLAFPLIFFS